MNEGFKMGYKPRMMSNEVKELVSPDDETARDVVFTFGAPRAIVVRINSTDTLGVPRAVSSKEEIQQKLESHRVVAAKFGIDGEAYRDRHGLICNGKHVFENETRIRLDWLLKDLLAVGYKLVNQSWFQKPAHLGKRVPDPTVSFTFSFEGEGIEMSERVKQFFESAYIDGMHLWCNPKVTSDGQPYRLDSINGYAGVPPKDTAAKPGYRLRYDSSMLVSHPCASGYDIGDHAAVPITSSAAPSMTLGDRLRRG